MAVAASFPWPLSSAGIELRLLFENAPLGFAQCDRNGAILAMNPALSALIGSSLQAVPRPSFSDLIPAPERDLSAEMFRKLMSGELDNFQVECLLNRSDGAETWLRWTAWGVCGSAHNPDCVLVLAQDITQVRNRHEQALRADGLQALGRMAGSIAHDFNNLLTGILLYCDLMLGDLGGQGFTAHGLSDGVVGLGDRSWMTNVVNGGLRCGDRLRKYAEEIRSASIQATGIVQQLLTVTRPRNLEPHPLCLNTVVEEMRNLLMRLMGENIELLFQLDSGLGLVRMDPAQAQQILLNLVLNARDAMPNGGHIQVETANCSVQVFRDDARDNLRSDEAAAGKRRRAAIPCVLFVVSDNGAGMNEETRRRIFQAYFTTKEQGRGSGLGLATVHNIVAARGGLVQVESAPERGTRVMVLLPSVDLDESSQRQEQRFSAGAGKK